MAEPVTRKIDTLTAATEVASNDELIVMDVSESAVNMTKKMTMSQIPISLASQLGANVVENAKIKDGAVTNSKLGADAVDGTKIADDAVDSEHIKDGAIDLAHMSANSIDSDQYVDGSIDRVHLAADIVDGTKIADNAIGNEHIRDSAALSVIGRSANTSGNPADISTTTDGYVLRVSGTTLGFGTVSSAGLASGAVTAEKIAAGAVTNAILGADAVDGAKIADNAIGNEHIRDSAALSVIGRSSSTSGNPADIAAGTDGYVLRRSGTTLGFGTVATAGIADGAVTNSKLGADAVNGTKIADDSIDSEHYIDGSIDTAHLSDSCVTEAKLGTIKRTIVIRVTSPLDAVELVNYGGFFPWSVSLNNFIVVDARINLAVSGSTDTTVVLSNQGGTMSTLTLASGATGLSASGAIAASYKTATTNAFLGVNVTAAGTGAKGLSITLVLQGVPA